jgi:putative two-component system response regulator
MNLKPSFFNRLRSLLNPAKGDDPESILNTLSRAIEAKDPYTLSHAERVSQYAMNLGRSLGVGGADLETLHKGGLLHDVGKIAISDEILLKPGKFSEEEFIAMKKHPILGCEMCEKVATLKDALPIIRHHHERLDGSGYPDGLREQAISPLVRIVTIVDIYDALRSRRSYKEPFSVDVSFKIMWEEAEKGWWDKGVLAHWEKLIRSEKA